MWLLQIVGKIRDRLDANVKLRNVFRNSSLLLLSEFLASQADSEAAARP